MSERLSIQTARQLLDFTGGDTQGIISDANAEQQLAGSVAVHNLLATKGIAYLADEVGMGKTYVALGAVALFRHFDPTFRVLVIAPRENIQDKWMKEWRNFVRRIVTVEDLRMKAIGGTPSRSLVKATNLIDLAGKVSRDHDRDFFVRLTSFSVSTTVTDLDEEKPKVELQKILPWLDLSLLNLRNKEEYRRNLGRALNCALPDFDLVIVDEAHNLKAGWSTAKGSARNAVLGCAVGGKAPELADERGFRGYARKATRVLFLSATPVEGDFKQLWNQLDLVGHGESWKGLADEKLSDDAKREIAREFLVRRVGTVSAGGSSLTKNQYRREWRRGGAETHDMPMAIPDDRQRLAVALVQKKVSEILGHSKHNHSFQIGLLASFESFSETTRAKSRSVVVEENSEDLDTASDFFVEQSAPRENRENEGMDIDVVNRLARDHQRRFHRSLPHPKMDNLVSQLSTAIETGTKSLVFVRRVASVDELQRKLEERYDDLLFSRLRSELLVSKVLEETELQIARYRQQRNDERHTRKAIHDAQQVGRVSVQDETSNSDSFFAWFFRGEGPDGILSGARLATRFEIPSGPYSTFFEENYVAELLNVQPADALAASARACNATTDEFTGEVRQRVLKFLKNNAKTIRRETFEAYQQAALELLEERSDVHRQAARIYLDEVFVTRTTLGAKAKDAPEPDAWLNIETLFTTFRKPERAALKAQLWPDSAFDSIRARLRDRELRRMLLATMARKGHPIVDLFVLVANTVSSIAERRRESAEEGTNTLAEAFLDLLDSQRLSRNGSFHSFAELSAASANFELIVTQNIPELRDQSLSLAPTLLGRLLRAQRPIGGMAGVVNKMMVRQFRMPGYPLVLISTDLLSEGEDLHTFCSNVVHYGIAWMPSALEQRNGRVDRVGSQTERRLQQVQQVPTGAEKLQVFYPHLRETVEVLQVQRVLSRLNRFLRLMHSNLGAADPEQAAIDVKLAMSAPSTDTPAMEEALVSAFNVTDAMTAGVTKALSSDALRARQFGLAFEQLRNALMAPEFSWHTAVSATQIVGMRKLGGRVQPFTLMLRSLHGVPVVRCVSPVGDVLYDDLDADAIRQIARKPFVRVSLVRKEQIKSYQVAVEGDVVLNVEHDAAASVVIMVKSVTATADAIEQHYNEIDPSYALIDVDIAKESDVER